MEPDIFDYSKEPEAEDVSSFLGEKRKLIQPTSANDPRLKTLKDTLVNWINSTLKAEHIVVQSLEEDLFDGLVLHHLLTRLAGVHVDVEEMALTSAAQIHKLELVLGRLNQILGLEEEQSKWSVSLIHNKDLLATIHLLVAMVRRFQPELHLPPSVQVPVVVVEMCVTQVSKAGIKSETHMETLTQKREEDPDGGSGAEKEHPIDHLLELDTSKVNTVKQAILHFVNKKVSSLGLHVADMDGQFADGVILLLLIGQLEGFFVPLCDFNLTPANHSDMLHNVTLALDLLIDTGSEVSNISPQDIVSQDVPATMKVLYALFKKHKEK